MQVREKHLGRSVVVAVVAVAVVVVVVVIVVIVVRVVKVVVDDQSSIELFPFPPYPHPVERLPT